MRYFLTGSSGQVGSFLTSLLHGQGHEVLGFDRAAGPGAGIRYQGVAGDICDPDTIAGVVAGGGFDAVFHLAGLNGMQPPHDIQRVNVDGTANLLAAMTGLKARVPRFIFMSSSAIYGPSPDDPITEAAPADPQTPYAASKAAAEHLVLRYHADTGNPVCIARPFNIVGPGQRAPLLYAKVAALLVAIERGERPAVLELGNLDSYRDFVDVRDVCTGLAAIAGQGEAGGIYNLCSGQATPIRALVDALCAEVALPVKIKTRPHSGADVPYQRGSHARLAALSGWQPQVTLDQSLRDTLAYMRDIAGPVNSDYGQRT